MDPNAEPEPILRPYDPARDAEAVHRIWREVHWIEPGQEPLMDRYLSGGRAHVAELGGEAECLVCMGSGQMRYLDEDLPLAAVTGVTTSRIARKRGLAGRLLARALADEVERGALVAGLGCFEQGYYDRLGFGMGAYEIHVAFDPARLTVRDPFRVPARLTPADAEAVHASRRARMTARAHGACNLDSVENTRCEMDEHRKGFGLGYRDAEGGITHYVWFTEADGESGPYRVGSMAYQTTAQFRELMALVRGLGDQVRQVKMPEPPGIQLQDLLEQPLRHRDITERSRFEAHSHAVAYTQTRILDLPGCLARTHLPCAPVRFNLRLSDPVEAFLPDAGAGGWRGIRGDYVVTLGPESSAEPDRSAALPALAASVGAFTRLWLGVRPATGLAATDDLSGPPDLLARLDTALRLPAPRPDWDF